jgi:hypothetical protein
MIEREVFQYWMGCIADRTNRVLSPPTYQEYFKTLSGELTNDEFVEAARLVFRNAEFWPAPKQFIDAIRPDPKLEGMRIFAELHRAGVNSPTGRYWVAGEIEAAYGSAALVAFRAIGGAERLNAMGGSDIAFTARDYAEAFVRAKSDAGKPPDRKALPSSNVGVTTFTRQ